MSIKRIGRKVRQVFWWYTNTMSSDRGVEFTLKFGIAVGTIGAGSAAIAAHYGINPLVLICLAGAGTLIAAQAWITNKFARDHP